MWLCLFFVRSFFMRPPLVYSLVPFQTCRIDPVCIFFVMRLGFLALRGTRVGVRFRPL